MSPVFINGVEVSAVSDAAYAAGWNGVTTIAPSKNTVYDKIETLGAGATLIIAETQVFSGTSPSGFADLNLSGTIGSQVTLVFLKVENAGGAEDTVSFRRNGDTDDHYGIGNAGCGTTTLQAGKFGVVAVVTDSTGKVEWRTNGAQAGYKVDVIAYIK